MRCGLQVARAACLPPVTCSVPTAQVRTDLLRAYAVTTSRSGSPVVVPTGVRGRSTWMIEREGVAMLRALAEQNALQVFCGGRGDDG
jgi:hypothetical protein